MPVASVIVTEIRSRPCQKTIIQPPYSRCKEMVSEVSGIAFTLPPSVWALKPSRER